MSAHLRKCLLNPSFPLSEFDTASLTNHYFTSLVLSLFQLYWVLLQFKQAEDTVNRLDLDGLVVIGGDDSNTNACLLGEYFRLASKTITYYFAPPRGFIQLLSMPEALYC